MSSGRINIGEPARDFTLEDTRGRFTRLSDYKGQQIVYLIFNRGFSCPFCRRHMAQLRQDYTLFTQRNVAVIAVGPESAYKFKTYWEENDLPFIGLADPEQTAARRYEQEINLFKLGRMPVQIIIDKAGIVRYAHYSNAMSDIPSNEEILAVIDRIAGESEE